MINQYKRITKGDLDKIKGLVRDASSNNADNRLDHEMWLGGATKFMRDLLCIVQSLVNEVERLRNEMAEMDRESEAGRFAGLPAIGSRVYKAQERLGVVYGDVTGIEIFSDGRAWVKFREIGPRPTSFCGCWTVDTFSTEVEARNAIKNIGKSSTDNSPAPIEYGAPFDEPIYVSK